MAEIAGPIITSAARVQGARIGVYYQAGASGYTKVYVDVRVDGTSRWTQGNATTSLTGYVEVATLDGTTPLDGTVRYEVKLRAAHSSGAMTLDSNVVDAPAWVTPAPTLTSVERTGDTTATIVFDGAVTTGTPRLYLEKRELPSGTWGPHTNHTPTATSGSFSTGSLSATAAYEWRAYSRQWNVDSGYSGTRTTAAWVQPPAAPSSVSATYVATDRAEVSWSATGADLVDILWRNGDGSGGWTAITSVSANLTGTPVALGANRDVQIGVRSRNAAGRSAIVAASGRVVTTPAAPPKPTAGWLSASTIRVLWSYAATVGDVVDVEFSTDNANWFPGATGQDKAVRLWDQTSATTTVPHWYRIRHRHASTGRVSTWVYSAEVAPQTAPHPPTLRHSGSLDATAQVGVLFTHNPVDGTAQTAARVRHRLVGTTTWTTSATLSSGTNSYGIPANTYANGQTVEAQAQTAGATGVFSDWSPSILLPLRPKPVFTLIQPTGMAGVWTAQDLLVKWTATAQDRARVSLYDFSTSKYTDAFVGSDVREHLFTGLEDGGYYRVEILGWVGEQTGGGGAQFDVDYQLPAAPDVSGVWDEATASVALTATPGVGTVQTERIDWHRLDPDGIYRLVGTADIDGSYEDRLASLGTATYKARAYAATGAWNDSAPLVVATRTRDCLLNYGPAGELFVRGGKVDRTGRGGAQEVSLIQYEGETLPTVHRSDVAEPETLQVTVSLIAATGVDNYAAWKRALAYPGAVTYREPGGITKRGTAVLGDWNPGDRWRSSVSFSLTETNE